MKLNGMTEKKGILLLVLMMTCFPVFAQKSKPKNMVMADNKAFHFGYSVGFNTMSFTIIPNKDYRVKLVQNPGININLITDYRMGKFLDVRFLPGIQFGQRDLTVINRQTDETGLWKIESVFVDLPVVLKYRALRVNNYAPYLIAGLNPRFDLTRAEIIQWQPATPMLKSFDYYVELGTGVDFYLPMVKVAMELKFAVGMRDIFLDPGDPLFNLYVSGIDKIYSRMVVLAFHVEQSR
jgi:hypothetical protein